MAGPLVCSTGPRRAAKILHRNDMVLRHMPLVKYVFGRMSLYYPNHLGKEDLTSSGVIGLMKAAQEYDPKNQTRFSTFAIPRIRGAILDELRTHDWVPRSVKRKMKTLAHTRQKLDRKLGGAVSERQLARSLGLSHRQLHKVLALSTPVSFLPLDNTTAGASEGETVPLAETLKNPKAVDPASHLSSAEEERSLGKSVLELPDPDRLVITLHYFKGMMLKDVARILKLSKSRVSQIHKQALDRLRLKLKAFQPASAV